METNFVAERRSGNDILRLRGYLDTVPSADTLVVMCHGLMMTCDINPIKGLSSLIAEGGYSVLRFDFAGTGVSDGDMIDMSPRTEIEDLAAVLSRCRTMGYRKVVALGHSLGGVVVSMTSAQYPELVDAQVLLAPAGIVEEDSRRGKVAYAEFDPDNVPEKVIVWDQPLGRRYMLDCQSLEVFDTASLYKGRTCIIQGTEDALVPTDCAREFADCIPGSELHLIDGGDHHFIRTKKETSRIVLDFLFGLSNRANFD